MLLKFRDCMHNGALGKQISVISVRNLKAFNVSTLEPNSSSPFPQHFFFQPEFNSPPSLESWNKKSRKSKISAVKVSFWFEIIYTYVIYTGFIIHKMLATQFEFIRT